MRQNQCIALFIVSSIVWVVMLNYFVLRLGNVNDETKKLFSKLNELEARLDEQLHDNELHVELKQALGEQINKTLHEPLVSENQTDDGELRIPRDKDAVAVLVFSCNRVTVARCLDQLIKYRKSKLRFPIIVTQDCIHEPTSNVIESYKNEVYHIQQPDQSDIPVPTKERKFKGYFKIARHYKWALNITFNHYHFDTVIVIEDDLDVSPDFYEYFAATLPVLQNDKTLWCVSAWNDNGKLNLVDRNAVNLLYRTDFFPGLGWMLTKSLWQELIHKWPISYWDDWMRRPEQRQNRSCIRPEVSRTRTFGKIGVSNGMFYDKYLKYIYLNDKNAEFTKKNLTYLTKDVYDPNFLAVVYGSPITTMQDLKKGELTIDGPVRLVYHDKASLKLITKSFGLMDDFRSGVPRTGYLGVISFFYQKRRVFITPNSAWNGYDPTW